MDFEREQREAAEAAWERGYGDVRRCRKHPEVKTSSDDGMFDAPCGRCESEMEDAWQAEMDAQEALNDNA